MFLTEVHVRGHGLPPVAYWIGLTVRFCCVFAKVTEIRLFLSLTSQQDVTDRSESWFLEWLDDVRLDCAIAGRRCTSRQGPMDGAEKDVLNSGSGRWTVSALG